MPGSWIGKNFYGSHGKKSLCSQSAARAPRLGRQGPECCDTPHRQASSASDIPAGMQSKSFFGGGAVVQKFRGEGSNPRHSCDPSHSSGNPRCLTRCTTRELLTCFFEAYGMSTCTMGVRDPTVSSCPGAAGSSVRRSSLQGESPRGGGSLRLQLSNPIPAPGRFP